MGPELAMGLVKLGMATAAHHSGKPKVPDGSRKAPDGLGWLGLPLGCS
jgi:hypothetical protein